MKCEKCGKDINFLSVGVFNYDGSDSYVAVYTEESPENAVVIETTPDWTGFDLSEEERRESIRCPNCHRFPFESDEIQVYHIVRLVMFKKDGDERMSADEAVRILEKHLRMCGMLMPDDWIAKNGDGSDFQVAYGMALNALREKREANGK